MRISAVVLSLSVAALLSGCTVDSPIRTADWWPTGYHGQHRYNHSYNENALIGEGVSAQETVIPHQMSVTTIEDNSQQMTVMTEAAPTLLNETYFAHGSARLSGSDKKAIHAVAQDVKSNNADVMVVGHASSRVDGPVGEGRKDEINYGISSKRADAVTKELTKQGVDPSKVSTIAKGDSEPNAHTGDRTQESADRRVEIFADAPTNVMAAPEPVFMQEKTVVQETTTTVPVFKPVVIEGDGPVVHEAPVVITPPAYNQ